MRIGTWNLAGRWSAAHLEFVLRLDCDVLLMTEVSERAEVPGHWLHLGAARMAARRRWAGVLCARPLTALPDPHPASALAVVDGVTFCCSVLPWKGSGGADPWVGTRHADRTAAAVEDLLMRLPVTELVWGGDWNHALDGTERAGTWMAAVISSPPSNGSGSTCRRGSCPTGSTAS